MVFRSGNPALKQTHFSPVYGKEAMTLEGTIAKTMTMLVVVFITGVMAYSIISKSPGSAMLMLLGGGIGGFIVALIIMFRRPAQPQVLMITYSLLEGLFVGAMSYVVENWYFGGSPGVVLQAMIATVGVFVVMLTLYRYRIIQPTKKFVLAVVSITGAIMLVYLANFVLMMMGTSIPFIHGNGFIGIGFSLLVTAMAALFLIIDFGVIENGVKNGAPKSMEWYGAFGLVITLIWLYVEMLRLLAKMRD